MALRIYGIRVVSLLTHLLTIGVRILTFTQVHLLEANPFIQLGKFSIVKDTKMNPTIAVHDIINVKSLMDCGRLLLTQNDCCVAVFVQTSNSCHLYKSGCCSSKIESGSGSSVLWKQVSGSTQNNEDCSFHRIAGSPSGVYTIYPENVPSGMNVYCDMDTDGGGWIVFQNRYNGSEDFFRTWNEYKNGFGSLSNEFWLGNDNINKLTETDKYKLRIDLEDISGATRYAEYSTFRIANEADNYRLSVDGYCGTAGDAMYYSDQMIFHTKDHDTTVGFNGIKCATDRHAGFWFKKCTWANPNGAWRPGVQNWDSNHYYQWKTIEGMAKISMKLRKK